MDCLDGWTLAGSNADGLYTLSACGYTVQLRFASGGVTITVDGNVVVLDSEDALLQGSTVYITDNFLRKALGADVIFDADERSLVLFLKDKSAAQTID